MQSIDSQVAAATKCPHWRKCWPGEQSVSESKRYATDSQNGLWNFDNRLRCYEITTMRVVAAFLLEQFNMQKKCITFEQLTFSR